MKRLRFHISILVPGFLFLLSSCSSNEEIRLDSPEGKSSIQFILNDNKPYYRVLRDNRVIIDTSALGFELYNELPLLSGFKMDNASMSSFRETWEPVWGQKNRIRNNGHQMLIVLKERSEPYREMHLEFKAYDDGVAFRYIFPEQESLELLEITNELTTFRFTEDMSAWCTAEDYDHHERGYRNIPLSSVDVANMPLILEGKDSLFAGLREASLVDYPAMRLKKSEKDPYLLTCDLIPSTDGVKAKVEIPFSTPWRCIQLAEEAGNLLVSSLILNLNEPSKIEDVSWIRPLKPTDMASVAHFAVDPEEMIDVVKIDSAFTNFERMGVRAIKMDFGVEKMSEEQFSHEQGMIGHYALILEKAARHKIMVYTSEEAITTGLERTWPNFMGREWGWGDENIADLRNHSTLAKELALMVVMHNLYPMAPRFMDDMQGHPAYEFIRDLPADWDDTRALNGEIGDFVTVARKKKDSWYIGSVSDENPREFSFRLDFLDDELSYEVVSFADGPAADWDANPSDYIIGKKPVKKDDELLMKLAAGGGQLAVIKPID